VSNPILIRLFDSSTLYLIVAFGVLTLATGVALLVGRHNRYTSYLRYVWVLALSVAVAETVSLTAAVWILAVLSFWMLREYFSLVEVRIQDRLGILGAYLSIPFMTYFIQVDWYGMFIISIPVYAFLAMPLLISLGGTEYRGTVFSIGVIDLGLFLCVYCVGHIGYLISLSTWWAAMLVACVAVCDMLCRLGRGRAPKYWQRLLVWYGASAVCALGVTFGLAPMTGIPAKHNLVLGLMIPALVVAGHHTLMHVERDLGIEESPRAGHGQILDNLKSLFYAGPVAFHYLRYFIL
jgi:phosphatidate cytidylyltransferase